MGFYRPKNRPKKVKPATRAGFNQMQADRTGLEPATSAVTGRHSNQLNYRSVPFGDGKDKGLSWNSEILESKNSGNLKLEPGVAPFQSARIPAPAFQISGIPGFPDSKS